MNPKPGNPTPRFISTPRIHAKSGGYSLRFMLLLLAGLIFVSPAAHAQTLTWDANGLTTGGSDGSGVWEGATNWFSSGAATSWTPGNSAVFGAGVAGNYVIDLTSVETAATVQFFTSGYTLIDQELI